MPTEAPAASYELPPSGRVVTRREAELILEHWKASNQSLADRHAIAAMFATSESTFDRILAAEVAKGGAREPRQGRGASPREDWVFAGPTACANLRRLEEAVAQGRVDDTAAEVRQRYLANGHGERSFPPCAPGGT